MSTPLIFFHQGYDPYIAFALWQARVTNPGAPIYLLGDASNDLSFLGVRHVPMREYARLRDEFVAIYQHFSEHELECERLCIERWFYLAAFLEREQLDRFVFLDSDVLLLLDLAPLLPTWQDCDVAGVPTLYGTCYCPRRSVVQSFCDYILAQYRNREQVEQWRATFRQYHEAPRPGQRSANVNDMTLAHGFVAHAGVTCLDLRQPREGVALNGNFLVTAKTHIDVRWGAAGRGVYQSVDGEWTRLACLHFGGWTKRYASAFSGWTRPLIRCFFKPNYRRNLKKLIQHYYFGRQFKKTIPFLPEEPVSTSAGMGSQPRPAHGPDPAKS